MMSGTPPPKYVVRSDGSLQFLSPTALGAAAGATIGRSRSRLLSPLSPRNAGASSSAAGSHNTSAYATPRDEAVLVAAAGSPLPAQQQRAVAPKPRLQLIQRDVELAAMAEGRGLPSPAAAAATQFATRLNVPQEALGLRSSAVALDAAMRERMAALSAQQATLGAFEYAQRAQQLLDDVAFELVRQVAAQCQERARLLATLWVRSSDSLGALAALLDEERRRREEESAQLQDALRRSRRDYLHVVQRLEQLIGETHEREAAAAAEADAREAALAADVTRLRDELVMAQAQAQRLARELEARRAERAAPAMLADPLAELDAAEAAARAAATPAEEAAILRGELQRQRVLLLDAISEMARLRAAVAAPSGGAQSASAVVGLLMRDAVSVFVEARAETQDKGLDPVEELQNLSASVSDVEDDDGGASAVSGGAGVGGRHSAARAVAPRRRPPPLQQQQQQQFRQASTRSVLSTSASRSFRKK